ncbi:head maturation protease, ClpP-related [Serinicoccus sediminis]|uniref:head maturation protease, ClpP-related n=1 Tax=Serinicoccus sediminis TaxID=2306021 RepID=UPI00101FE249|nr:head maturation protease, ClpP-related [Serinicoccus sediminis]
MSTRKTRRPAAEVLQGINDREQASVRRATALGARKRWFRVENVVRTDEDGRTRAKVYIYDPIGGWFGVTPNDFVRELDELDVDVIELHINSPGGSVYDGIAIMNALRQHDAEVVGFVDGLAASAASFIAVGGCDELVMAAHSELMVHDALVLCVGNAADMRDMADHLDRISDNIAAVYARKAGGSAESWRDVMREERWYSAAEAVAAGLADRTDEDPDEQDDDQDDDTENRWRDLFGPLDRTAGTREDHRAPAAAAHNSRAATAARATSPTAAANGDTTQEGALMKNEQRQILRQLAGVADDADDATIVAALQEAHQELTEDTTPDGTTTSARIPDGMELVDSEALAALQADATAGREARNQQVAEHRTRVVADAIRAGKIPVARRQHWIDQLTADPGAEATLTALRDGTVPLDEQGHAEAGPEESDQAAADYKAAWGKRRAGTEQHEQKGA